MVSAPCRLVQYWRRYLGLKFELYSYILLYKETQTHDAIHETFGYGVTDLRYSIYAIRFLIRFRLIELLVFKIRIKLEK